MKVHEWKSRGSDTLANIQAFLIFFANVKQEIRMSLFSATYVYCTLTLLQSNIDEIISACNYVVADTDRLLPTNVHANNAFMP